MKAQDIQLTPESFQRIGTSWANSPEGQATLAEIISRIMDSAKTHPKPTPQKDEENLEEVRQLGLSPNVAHAIEMMTPTDRNAVLETSRNIPQPPPPLEEESSGPKGLMSSSGYLLTPPCFFGCVS